MWDVLGIAETHDLKAIRRAYAARLRTIGRDTAAFQKLRAAYEQALAHAGRIMRPEIADGAVAAPLVPDPAISGPAPDPAAPLLRKIDLALKHADFDTALALQQHALAQGLFPFGVEAAVTERILRAALSDRGLSAKDYLALVKRFGWNLLPTRNDPALQLRQTVIERAEAEEWFLGLTRAADQRFGGFWLPKGWFVKQALRNLRQRRIDRRNARMLLQNRDSWFQRLSPAVTADLRGKLNHYHHYANWIGHRFDPKAIARAERMLAFDGRWGNISRKVLRFVLAIVWLGLVAAMVDYGPGAWVVLVIVTMVYIVGVGFLRRSA